MTRSGGDFQPRPLKCWLTEDEIRAVLDAVRDAVCSVSCRVAEDGGSRPFTPKASPCLCN
ncbi:hypothetical protein GBS60_16445 [Escherichia coli]|nr:hypothetical protein [Escherichia coli]